MTNRIARSKARPAKVSAREFFARDVSTPDAQDALIKKCVSETMLTKSTIVNHVRYGLPISKGTAMRLVAWNSEIDFEKTMARS